MGDRLRFNRQILENIFNKTKSEVGLTLSELARKTNVSRNTLKRWRNGTYSMPRAFFKDLCMLHPAISAYKSDGKIVSVSTSAQRGGKSTASKLSTAQLNEKMRRVREKRKYVRQINKHINDNAVLELFGILMGDGCICKYYSKYNKCDRKVAVISGNLVKDFTYNQDYVLPLLKSTFEVNVYLNRRESTNTINLIITNSAFFDWFKNNGFPVGKKGQIKIPEQIYNLPTEKTNHLIQGLFDTDGCISARKDEAYKYPYIYIASCSEPLRLQLKSLLRQQGINAYIHAHSVIVRGNRNCFKWFELIGSNNLRNRSRYEYWRENKVVPVGR